MAAKGATPSRPDGLVFLLAQVGGWSAQQFAKGLGTLGLTPPQAGALRAIATTPGQSQQSLSRLLGLVPSRTVALVDDLESRGLVTRERSTTDRRVYALALTPEGGAVMAKIGGVVKGQEQDALRALSADERAQLRTLLERIRDAAGLTAGVHPGYSTMGRPRQAG